MLRKLFLDIINNKSFFIRNIKGWKDFEEKISNYIINNLGMIQTWKKNINDFSELKLLVSDKLNDNYSIKNTKWKNLDNYFIFQPFGSQSYPDFIIFSKDKIIPLEIKMSSNSDKIMWNSWFPLNTGIYIYLSLYDNDITFFRWCDILTNKEREIMTKFFEELKGVENEINNKLSKYDLNNTGFQVFLRKAFFQKKTKDTTLTSYIKNPNRSYREKRVLEIF